MRSFTSRFIALGLISASSLAFEILLTRLFSIQQFYHFAFVVVSLAIMGIAASGTLLALKPKHPPLAVIAVIYSVSIALAYLTINFLPFDSYSIAWDRRQVFILLLYFLAAGVPFLFSGWAIAACLADAGPDAYRPYAANLVGSAIGCPGALLALAYIGAEGALVFTVALGLLAAAFFSNRRFARGAWIAIAMLVILLSLKPPAALNLRLSPYKPLVTSQLPPDASLTDTVWSSASRADVVESGSIHIFPGLSLNTSVQIPTQAALFIDGEGPLPITSLDPDGPSALKLAEHMPAGLAYQLRPNAHALILQPGAGLDTTLALASGAEHVSLSVPEPLVAQLLEGPYADFTYHLLQHPRVELVSRSDRGALREGQSTYDIIQFSLSAPYRPVTSGAFSLAEQYSLTSNAFEQAFRRLSEDGILVITSWLGTPPSEAARVWATLLAALEAEQVDDPGERLIAYRGMRTATIIAARHPFTDVELATTRQFLSANSFDPIFLPDLNLDELNRYNRLPQDVYHDLFTALLEDPEATLADYEFNLRPPSDDSPFFYNFFRWRQTPQVLATLGMTWQPFGGSGYLVMIALLALVAALALPIIMIPLVIRGDAGRVSSPHARVMCYFGFIGAGYLLIEIPFMQQLTLLFDRPALSLAAVLFILLLSSGIGSLLSQKVKLRSALAGLAGVLILLTATLPSVIRIALPWSLTGRLALVTAFLALPGILMGIPFAAGLRQIEKFMPGQIPLAWAINGAISGVCGVLSALIALSWGFNAALALGIACYLGAWATAPSLAQKQ